MNPYSNTNQFPNPTASNLHSTGSSRYNRFNSIPNTGSFPPSPISLPFPPSLPFHPAPTTLFTQMPTQHINSSFTPPSPTISPPFPPQLPPPLPDLPPPTIFSTQPQFLCHQHTYPENPYYPPYYPERQISVGPLVSESSEPWKLFEERDQMRSIIEQKLELSFYPMDWCVNFECFREILLQRYPELADDLSSPSFENGIEVTVLQTPPLPQPSLISPPLTIKPNLDMADDSKVDKVEIFTEEVPILPSPVVIGLASMENQEPNKKYIQEGGQEETKHGIAESPSLAADVCSPNPSHFCASKILCELPSIPPIVLFEPLPKLPLPIEHATTTIRIGKNIQNVVGHQDPSHAHKMFDLFSNPTICQQNKLIQAYSSHVCYHYCFFVKFPPTRPPLKPPDTSQVLATPPFNQPTPYLQQATSVKLNRFDQTLCNFSKMLSHGILPDSFVVPRVVKACGGLLALKIGKHVHGVASVSGFASDLLLLSSLVHMYIKCDDIRHAHKLFDTISQPDVVVWSAWVSSYARHDYVVEAKELFNKRGDSGVEPNLISWNGMIAGFNNSELYSEAIAMFQQMHLQGIQPDGVTIFCVLPAAGDLEDLNMGIQVHGYVIKQSDKCVISALIDMYGKCACSFDMSSQIFDEIIHYDVEYCNAFIAGLSRNGLAEDALRVFGQIRGQGVQMSVVSWTSTIACCSQNGKDIEALELFREMQIAGVEPNSVTIPCLLPACGNIAVLMYGKAAHCFSLRRGIFNNVYVCSALIDMYTNCGKIQASRLCFDGLTGKNWVGWNTMMGGYAMHGKAKEALENFHFIQRSGQKPDFISFTSILSACNQNGLTKQEQAACALVYFNACVGQRVGVFKAMMQLIQSSSWSWWIILKASFFKGSQGKV